MKLLLRPCSFIFLFIIACLLLPLFSNSSPSVHDLVMDGIVVQTEVGDSIVPPMELSIEE